MSDFLLEKIISSPDSFRESTVSVFYRNFSLGNRFARFLGIKSRNVRERIYFPEHRRFSLILPGTKRYLDEIRYARKVYRRALCGERQYKVFGGGINVSYEFALKDLVLPVLTLACVTLAYFNRPLAARLYGNVLYLNPFSWIRFGAYSAFSIIRSLIPRIVTNVVKSIGLTNKASNYELRGNIIDVLSTIGEPKTNEAKPHARAAGLRTVAVDKIVESCWLLGKEPFYYQHSKNSYGTFAGSLDPLVTKDCYAPPKYETPTENSVIVMVDDDYYAKLDEVLLDYPDNIWMIYSMVPKHAGYHEYDYMYCFDGEGELVLQVEGGSAFKHKLWDFSGDHFTLQGGWRHFWSTHGFLVERVSLEDDHDIIVIVPMVRAAWYVTATGMFLSKQLKPLKPIVEGCSGKKHIVLSIDAGGDNYVSISAPNIFTSCDLDRTIFDQLTQVVACTTSTITKHSLESAGVPNDTSGLALAWFRDQPEEDKVLPQMSKFVPNVCVYSYGTPDVWKPVVSKFMEPLVGGTTFIPNSDIWNEWAAIETRLLAFNNDVEIKPFIIETFLEFLNLLSEDTRVSLHSLHPTDSNDVMERTRNKAQFSKMLGADLSVRHKSASGFIKAEAYPEHKDPRGIINYSSESKHLMAPYSYSFGDMLKLASWYAFVSPDLLESRFSEMTLHGSFYSAEHGLKPKYVELDGKRFDGHVNRLQRALALMGYLFFFQTSYAVKLQKDYRQDYFCRVRFAEFFFYLIWKRGSGSMFTSVENSLLSAFFEYLANRLNVDGVFMKPKQAYECIGLVGGDDVIRCRVFSEENFKKRIEKMGKLVGHEFTVLAPKYPTFLGRAYGGILNGDFSSCLVPDRVFVKLHVTADRLADPKVKIVEKATAVMITDSHTPIISVWAQSVLACRDAIQYAPVKENLPFQTDLSQALYLYSTSDVMYDFQPNGCSDWMADLWGEWLIDHGFNSTKFEKDCAEAVWLDEKLKQGPYCGTEVEELMEGDLVIPQERRYEAQTTAPEPVVLVGSVKTAEIQIPGEPICKQDIWVPDIDKPKQPIAVKAPQKVPAVSMVPKKPKRQQKNKKKKGSMTVKIIPKEKEEEAKAPLPNPKDK